MTSQNYMTSASFRAYLVASAQFRAESVNEKCGPGLNPLELIEGAQAKIEDLEFFSEWDFVTCPDLKGIPIDEAVVFEFCRRVHKTLGTDIDSATILKAWKALKAKREEEKARPALTVVCRSVDLGQER